MRSVPSLALAVALAACGNDVGVPPPERVVEADPCETSYLEYDNFGAPFVLDWCRGCHSSAVPEAMRQHAPIDVNFDTSDDFLRWQNRILVRATGSKPTMPPAGGPSSQERALLAEWIACGMR